MLATTGVGVQRRVEVPRRLVPEHGYHSLLATGPDHPLLAGSCIRVSAALRSNQSSARTTA